MAKTLSQLRSDLATRLGFGSQQGAEIIQAPMLDSIIQQSQDSLIAEFGTQIGSTIPAEPFTNPNDTPSVPEHPLWLKAVVMGREHYRQPMSVDVEAYQNWEAGIRGFVK